MNQILKNKLSLKFKGSQKRIASLPPNLFKNKKNKALNI